MKVLNCLGKRQALLLTLLNNNAGPSQYVRIGKTMVLPGFYRMEFVGGSDGRPVM